MLNVASQVEEMEVVAQVCRRHGVAISMPFR